MERITPENETNGTTCTVTDTTNIKKHTDTESYPTKTLLLRYL